jgi:hypothetical protein
MQDSTEMLANFNRFSAASYPQVAQARALGVRARSVLCVARALQRY